MDSDLDLERPDDPLPKNYKEICLEEELYIFFGCLEGGALKYLKEVLKER